MVAVVPMMALPPPPAVMSAPMDLIDNARGLARCGELAENAAGNRRGLGRTRGEEAGKSAGYDGQRNSSLHHGTFLMVGAPAAPRVRGWQPKHVRLIFPA
jgi:hypothetical protein